MYTAEINRNNPALILFLIDCSYSMSEKYGSTGMTKGQYLAKITNECIDQVILSCEKGDEIRAYFEIGVIGYGDQTEIIVPVQTVIDLANNPKELINRQVDGIEVRAPIWLSDPTREANTDMLAGFKKARELLDVWCAGHRSSYPPVLIHVSDGKWTDHSPVNFAVEMQSGVFTDDGPCIIMNIHIGGDNNAPIVFPDREPIEDEHSQGLFQMSSVLSDSFLSRAKEKYPHVVPGARGYMFNAKPDDLSKFFDIGTRLKS